MNVQKSQKIILPWVTLAKKQLIDWKLESFSNQTHLQFWGQVWVRFKLWSLTLSEESAAIFWTLSKTGALIIPLQPTEKTPISKMIRYASKAIFHSGYFWLFAVKNLSFFFFVFFHNLFWVFLYVFSCFHLLNILQITESSSSQSCTLLSTLQCSLLWAEVTELTT